MLKTALSRSAMTSINISYLLLLLCSSTSGERWSRQLTGEGHEGEWIPLQGDRRQPQAQARVLVEPQFQNPFFPQETYQQDYLAQGGARQLFIQSPNSVSQQNFVPRSQQQPIRLTLMSQFNALPQSFSFPRSNPVPFNDFRQTIQAQFHQPHLVVPPGQLNNQIYHQPQKGIVLSPLDQAYRQSPIPESQKTVNNSSSGLHKPNLPTLKEKIANEFTESPVNGDKYSITPTTPSSTTVEKEEVQLLYVPLETLQNKKFDLKQFLKNPSSEFSLKDSIGSPGQINNQLYPSTTPSYRPEPQVNNIKGDFHQHQARLHQEAISRNSNSFYQPSSVTPSPFSQTTHPVLTHSTPKSKKLKAHQPPLAIYMTHHGKDKARLGDVLSILKESDTVSVLDSIPPNAPKVFIGPNNLKVPPHIAKFELPYLSNIDGNRIPRRIESLPFFVAPLNYKAPNGFAKIPFPAPHVGSVIVNPFMKDSEESSTIITFGSPNSFNSFPQSTTEGFRSTLKEALPTKPTMFNYFPSTTSSQSSPTSLKPPSVPFSKMPNQYSTIYSTKNPESNIISSSRQPSFYSTSARPTVSFFGFSEPTFNTQPSSTNKPSPPVFDNRGHYITNSVVETSHQPQKQSTTYKAPITERPNTSPIPASHIQKNPYNFINPFILRNPYEPQDYIQNIRDNDGRHYEVVERPVIHNFNQFPQQRFPQFNKIEQNSDLQNIKPTGDNILISSPSYPTEVSPTVSGPTINTLRPVEQREKYNQRENERDNQKEYENVPNQGHDQNSGFDQQVIGGFIPSFNRYPNSNSNLESEPELNQVTESQYEETEPPTEPTTTTSTTTTPAPTTRFTRRPISRGRPRYTTTPKTEGDETTIRPTTRRTPLRERRPTTYRSRITTTTDPSVNEETTKRTRDFSRIPSRQKSQDGEITTTESTVERNKNQRFRSRGRVQYKNSNNYEGSDLTSKKNKDNGESDDIAYQRDVLHQNYPVTVAERLSTLEVRTTTANPNSTPNNSNNIKIYETTGSTSKTFSTVYDTRPSEQPYYENEAVFQREPEKFLTHPDEYIEINGKISGRTTPTQHFTSGDVYSSTTTIKPLVQTVTEEQFESQHVDKSNSAIKSNNDDTKESEIDTYNYGDLPIKYAPDVLLTEAPIPKFRTKLRNRNKLYQSITSPKINGGDSENIASDTFITSTKKIEETTTEQQDYSRKISINPVTHRPTFSSRRTTMRIEEIEEELKSKRTQLRLDSRIRANKYPIYNPSESVSTTGAPTEEENDITTTKRTKIIRRKPIRTTTPSTNDVVVTEASSEKPVNTKVRRVRVRTRVRKPTTEKNENAENESINDEKYTTTTPKSLVQKYSTRNRQKYFKRPPSTPEKNEQNNENGEDQVYFDSINRPEIIRFNPENGNHEYVEYNENNGKDDTLWSPKTNPNAFRPMFNPNFIESRQKFNSDELSKISYSSISSEEPEIITIGPEDDILVEVTPSTNNMKGVKNTRREKEYVPEKPSTFESVLEEVMRNFDEQETDYMTVVKHEGGEIGEIPPETTIQSKDEDTTQSAKDVYPTTASLPTTVAQKRFFSTAPDVQVSSTERQGRRRGSWRRINVRPIHKDLLESAESQFYKNSKNELTKEEKTTKYEKSNFVKAVDKILEEPKLHTTTTTAETTTLQTKEETYKPSETKPVEEQTDYPDLIAMEVLEDDVTYSPSKEKSQQQTTEQELITPYLIGKTEAPIKENSTQRNEKTFTTEINNLQETTSAAIIDTTSLGDDQINTEDTAKIETTTQIVEDKQKTDEEASSKSFLEVMEELLASDNEQQIDKSVDVESKTSTEEKKTEGPSDKELETTTAGFKFFDPKSVISTSVSTQISHETEICFRGKCIKTNKSDSKK